MHTLQPKHTKLKKEEVEKLLQKLNISIVQLPKISKEDVSIPKDCEIGDVIVIERVFEDGVQEFYRVVS